MGGGVAISTIKKKRRKTQNSYEYRTYPRPFLRAAVPVPSIYCVQTEGRRDAGQINLTENGGGVVMVICTGIIRSIQERDCVRVQHLFSATPNNRHAWVLLGCLPIVPSVVHFSHAELGIAVAICLYTSLGRLFGLALAPSDPLQLHFDLSLPLYTLYLYAYSVRPTSCS